MEDIFRENPGVSEKNFKAGSTIRIMANANVHRIKTETVEAEKLDSFGTYKAKSNESWEGIARRLGVDVDDLKEINPEVELKKNTIIAVPKYEKIEVERQYVAEDLEKNGRRSYGNIRRCKGKPDADTGQSESGNSARHAVVQERPGVQPWIHNSRRPL